MSTNSPINAIPKPALSDAANIETATHNAIELIDKRINAVFTSTSARDVAIPAPTEGMECYVTATGEKYLYNGTLWVSAKPRIVRTTVSTIVGTGTYGTVTGLSFSVEASSRYVWDLHFPYQSIGGATNDMKMRWQGPGSPSGPWTLDTVSVSDDPVGPSLRYAGMLDFTDDVAFGTSGNFALGHAYGSFAFTLAGTLTCQIAEFVSTVGMSVEMASGAWMSMWKIG